MIGVGSQASDFTLKDQDSKEFKNIQMSVFDKGKRRELRSAPAFPWEVPSTRWSYELK